MNNYSNISPKGVWRMETEKIGRKEREYLAHREEILSAAEKVFAAKGFFPTTMSDIAREAEFGTGTLYKYFKSKEELYFTLIDEKVEEVNRLVNTELSQKTSAVEKIKKVLKLQFEFIERNRDFFRIYISERNRFEWTVKDELGKGLHEKMVTYISILAEVMRQGIKGEEFRPMNPMDLAHALVGIVNSFVFEWMISREPYPLISKLDTVLEIFLEGVQQMERRK
jgi:TetR/AcrR family transcriptional regulator